ncbi:MAG: hypothetical protein IKN71_02580 [Alphaproteobacteria bacterium]|nr:hypothetical protein [Alphaproteobacteria bacterium]
MADLDKQIRDILSRSYPVNDNRPVANKDNLPAAQNRGAISIVGNGNVIISAELLALETVLLVGFAIFMLANRF